MSQQITSFTQTAIANLYISILGRNPEPAGFGHWCIRLADNGNTQAEINKIAADFSLSPEFVATYGGQQTTAAVTLMYNNVLNRAPDAGGLQFWSNYANSLINAGTDIGVAYALTGNAIITQAGINGTSDTALIVAKQTAAIASGTSAPTTTYTLTTGIDTVIMDGSGTVNGIIDFGGGTAAAAGTTMNANDTITGTSAISGDLLKVSLQNAGGAIGATVAAVAQVNTLTIPTVTADVQQVNSYVFGTGAAGSKTQTYTYGGENGSFTTSTTAATQATNFTASVNAAAGSTVATVGTVTPVVAATTATGAATLTLSTVTGLVTGMSIATSTTASDITAGTFITAINTGTKTITLNQVTAGELATSDTLVFGGGTAGVTVRSPSAGTVSPTIAFGPDADVDSGDSSIPTQALTVANVSGNQGDVVNFTYGGAQGSYTIASNAAGTTSALVTALNSVAGATVAFQGGTSNANSSAAQTTTTIIVNEATAGAARVGQTIAVTSGTGAFAAGTTITAVTSTTITVSAAPTTGIADNDVLTTGGGVAGVTVYAPRAGVAPPALVFSGTGSNLPTSALTIANGTAVGAISFGNNSGLDALYVNNTSGQAATIDQGSVSGATQLWADRSTGDVTFTAVGRTTTIGINGNGTTQLGAVTATTVAGTTATSLAINGGVNAGAVNLNANADSLLKTVNITSTGGVQSGTTGQINKVNSLAATATATAVNINATTSLNLGTGISGAALTTINISGAATLVNLGTNALASTVATVNASSMTAGGVSAVLNTGAPTGFAFTGGAGKDTVTVTGAFSNTPGTLSGGGGTTDTIVITTAAMTSATGARFTNFEVLNNRVAASQDASVVAGITNLETEVAGGGFTSMTSGQAANVAVRINLGSTATTYQLTDSTGTADVLGLTFATSTVTTVVNATALAVGGFETLNLTVSGGGTSIYNAAGTTLLTAGTDFGSYAIGTTTTDLKTVNVSGAYAARVDISSNATRVTTLNAAANTAGANLKFAGQTGALIVNATAAADLIEVGTKGAGGTVALTTGAGNDTVTGTYANIAALTSLAGGDGTDTVSYSDTSGSVVIVDSALQNVTGIENFIFASTSGGINWVVGGYANAMTASSGGTLDISAAALTTGALVIDASGLSGANLLKLATTISGDVAVKVTGSAAGRDSITVSATGITTTTKMIEIDASANTSAGVTVNVAGSSAGGGTANYIRTGTGADVITLNTAGSTAWLVTAGAGRDTITAGNGVDTVIYTTAATSVGDAGINVDSIVGFATTADKIGLTNGAATLLRGVTIETGGSKTTAATLATAVTDNTSVGSLADVYAAIAANANFGSGNFAGSAAAAANNQIIAKQINFANGGASGNYLVINDSIAGFQGGFDLVVRVGTATIAAGDIIPV